MFPGIFLGNGATVKKKEYLKSIGVSHVLNAAEFRGVNVAEDYFGSTFEYKGLRVEDTPQTQICRLNSNNLINWLLNILSHYWADWFWTQFQIVKIKL